MVSSLISPARLGRGLNTDPKSAQKCLLNKWMNKTRLALVPESSPKTGLALSHHLTRSANGVIADNHKPPTSESSVVAAKGFHLPPSPSPPGSPSKLMLVKETPLQVRGLCIWFVFVAWKLLTSRDILLPSLAHEKLMTFFSVNKLAACSPGLGMSGKLVACSAAVCFLSSCWVTFLRGGGGDQRQWGRLSAAVCR